MCGRAVRATRGFTRTAPFNAIDHTGRNRIQPTTSGRSPDRNVTVGGTPLSKVVDRHLDRLTVVVDVHRVTGLEEEDLHILALLVLLLGGVTHTGNEITVLERGPEQFVELVVHALVVLDVRVTERSQRTLVVLVDGGGHVGVVTQGLLVVGVALGESQSEIVLTDRTRDVGACVQLLRLGGIDVYNALLILRGGNPVHPNVRGEHLYFACHSGNLLIYLRCRYTRRAPKTLTAHLTCPTDAGWSAYRLPTTLPDLRAENPKAGRIPNPLPYPPCVRRWR